MQPTSEVPDLTRRERDVLAALCRPVIDNDVFAEPASVKQIAAELWVTDAAVKQHLLHLYDKFGIVRTTGRRRVELARAAMRRGALDASDLRSADHGATGVTALLTDGREAFARRDFPACFDLLAEADARQALESEDLERVGEAGWWIGRHDESMVFRQRAYHARVSANEPVPAAVVAIMLTIQYANRMEFAVAGGWFAKAERLLEGQDETPATGWRDLVACLFTEARGDWEGVLTTAQLVSGVGRRQGVADLEALGLAFEGLALTHQGDAAAGTRLLDEAMASALGGSLGAAATGVIYCRMLCACLDLHDFGRAAEWTEAIGRHTDTPGLAGLPGDCRTHRAEVLFRRGAWLEGAEEARLAVEETRTFDLAHVGIASYELGEIRLRQGNLEGAEDAFLRAHEYGSSAEPGLALLRLIRGETTIAVAGLEAALASAGEARLARVRLLPARAELALATHDLVAARAATQELVETASTYGTPALLAAAEHAQGALELTEGRVEEAAERLAAADRLWQRAEMPYEWARSRVLHAECHLARGDRYSFTAGLEAARSTFERLGATLDIQRVAERISAHPELAADGRQAAGT